MTADDIGRFSPRPRRNREEPSEANVALRGELERILHRCESVSAVGRQGFTEGTAAYDVASMALIRLASLLEKPTFGRYASLLSSEEMAAIRATRNVVAHAGHVGRNDDLFYDAVTVRLPIILQRLLTSET